ncbi:MAG: DUF5317 domain-containing protein [Anaerolineae bacterium]|nr:DUF5317 domain-containing protein [Anaerolineae bacterium]
MILVAAVAVSTLIALVRGGRLARLADLPIGRAWLVLAAVVFQYPLVYIHVRAQSVLGVPVASLLMAASWILLLVAVWANRRLPGVALVGLGMVLNLLVMSANGGWMPVTPEGLARLHALDKVVMVGDTARVWGAKNIVLERADTRLWALSDIFIVPPPLPSFPLRAAFSVGDILIAAGLFWLLQSALVGSSKDERPLSESVTGQ